MTIQTSEEVADGPRPYVVAGRIALGLYVNAVKPESILVNDAVNPIIARAA